VTVSFSLGRPNSRVTSVQAWLDRLFLEIVAEGEIPQHLEEGVVARGVADIVEVVVLAAGADAFLRGGGPDVRTLLLAGEDVLELHHARIGEHQRRVVARHERARRHHLMALALEVVEEGGPDFVDAAHRCSNSWLSGCPPGRAGGFKRSSEAACRCRESEERKALSPNDNGRPEGRPCFV